MIARGAAAAPAAYRAVEGWPHDLAVRPLDLADAAALRPLLDGDDFRHSGSLLEPFGSDEALLVWLRTNRAAGAFQIVALAGASLVGYAGLYPGAGRQSHAGSMTLAVLPSHQGRGCGRALGEVVVAAAAQLAGLARIHLTVHADNARAIALYRRLGFVVEGRRVAFAERDGAYVDALSMARLLGDARQAPPS